MVKGKGLKKGSAGTKTMTITMTNCNLKVCYDSTLDIGESFVLDITDGNYLIVLRGNQIIINGYIRDTVSHSIIDDERILAGTLKEINYDNLGEIDFIDNERGYECNCIIDLNKRKCEIKYTVDVVDGIK